MTTEAWLIRSVTTRSEADFDSLFLAHYDGVYRLLYRIVGAREEAEDLAQETFPRRPGAQPASVALSRGDEPGV